MNKIYFCLLSIKGSSVYYDGKRLNHDMLAFLCDAAYLKLSDCYASLGDKNKLSLYHGLLWDELPYRTLVAVLSRIILDWASLLNPAFSQPLVESFGSYAKFPSFLKEIKKEYLSLEFHILYFADKSPAGYLYNNKFFPKFSDFEVYVRGLYPSSKYQLEFVENSHLGV